jgi:hypothetical protein
MKHLLDLAGKCTTDLDIFAISSNGFFALFASQVSHVCGTSEYLASGCDFEAFHDDLARLLLGFHSLFFWFDLGDEHLAQVFWKFYHV